LSIARALEGHELSLAMTNIDSNHENRCFPSRQVGHDGVIVIAIVGYRNADDVATCVAALSRAAEKNFLVSICENGGREAYRDLISALEKLVEPVNTTQTILDERVADIWSGRLLQGNQRIRIYRAKSNIGYAGGINICIRQIDPAESWSALWVLNPDTEPDPNALTALAARARACDYGMIASRIVVKSTQRIQTYGGRWRPLMARGFNIGWDAPRDAVPDVAEIEASMMYVPGGSMFVTREYVEGVGLLDERYFLYCEEVDWCFRRGHRRIGYAHNSIVYHSVGTTIGSNFDPKKRSRLSVYLDERNKLLFTRRFYPAHYPLVIVTTLLLTLQYLESGAVKNFFVALSGWCAGLRGEEGPPRWFVRGLASQEA
jgi:N-acetylglucosaminyl-diphospho-decaprenol L-rhamnosyltransferase